MNDCLLTGTQEERERYLRAMERLSPLSVPTGKLDRHTHPFEARRKEDVLGAFSTVAGAVHHAEYHSSSLEPAEVWDARADRLLAAVFGIGRIQYTDSGSLFEEDNHVEV